MRIMITGAAGFLGSHLCDRFLADGHDVIGIDNFITGSPDNIAHIIGNAHFHFLEADVTNYIYVPGTLDAILHFASPASPIDYQKFPIQTLKVGAMGTHNALGLAKAKGARILIASTSEVYGDPQVHPQVETYWGRVNPIGPRGVYDEAKRYGEAITMAYHRYHGVDTRIVRIFNTYGPRMKPKDGRVIPAFLTQAIEGTDLTVFGKGQQTRSFSFVTDTVDGIVRLLNSDYNGPVNVGNPNEYTIRQLAQLVIERYGKTSDIIEKPYPQDDPKVRQPDITLARKLLDWEPKVSLEAGLDQVYAYFLDMYTKNGRF